MGGIDTNKGWLGVAARGLQDPSAGRLPILFLHGVGSDKSVWTPQVNHFGSDERLAIAADYPGYGESGLPIDATRADFADAMLALLDAKGVERAHICGLSLGGIIAMEMALRAPQRVESLILADTFAFHPDGAAIHDGSISAMESLGMADLARDRVDRLLGTHPPDGLREEVIAVMSRIDPDAYRLGARAVWKADLRARVGQIACPTLVLCGHEDKVTPPTLSDDLAQRIEGAVRLDIPGAGHLSNAERPDVFNRAVEMHLSKTEQKREGYRDINLNA